MLSLLGVSVPRFSARGGGNRPDDAQRSPFSSVRPKCESWWCCHLSLTSTRLINTNVWGLHEFLGNHLVKGVARHLEDHIKWFTNQKYQGLWFKAQSELLALLLVNFKSHDSAVLVNYSADKTHKVWQPIIAQQDDDDFLWPDTLWNAKLKWLPFGTMCFHAICERYQDEGVTDCISKIRAFIPCCA